jgi:hypothetical protein
MTHNFLELSSEFLLHDSHSRGHDMSESLLNGQGSFNLILNRFKLYEVLQVWLRHQVDCDLSFEIDCFVVLNGLGHNHGNILILVVEVVLVVGRNQQGDWFGFVKGCHGCFEHGHSLAHALGSLSYFLVVVHCDHVVGHGLEVQVVVLHHI